MRHIVAALAICAFVFPVLPASASDALFRLSSSAFGEGGALPDRYGCGGENISPPLSWENPPTGTRSFALVLDDPDGLPANFVHWIVYDVPGTERTLPEGLSPLVGGFPLTVGTQGTNNFAQRDYKGPCTSGVIHTYVFKIYALDTVLGLPAGVSRNKLVHEMNGHILGEDTLSVRYSGSGP